MVDITEYRYYPRETGVLCGVPGHSDECLCDLKLTALPQDNVSLDQITFAEIVADQIGWPSTPSEVAQFMCYVLGLNDELAMARKLFPEKIAALDYIAASRMEGLEDPEWPAVEAGNRHGRYFRRLTHIERLADQVEEALAAGFQLREVRALLDLEPKELLAILRSPNAATLFDGMDEDEMDEFDFDVRTLSVRTAAAKWGVSKRQVERFRERCGLVSPTTKDG